MSNRCEIPEIRTHFREWFPGTEQELGLALKLLDAGFVACEAAYSGDYRERYILPTMFGAFALGVENAQFGVSTETPDFDLIELTPSSTELIAMNASYNVGNHFGELPVVRKGVGVLPFEEFLEYSYDSGIYERMREYFQPHIYESSPVLRAHKLFEHIGNEGKEKGLLTLDPVHNYSSLVG